MDDRNLVYQLVYRAFLDIRVAAYNEKSHKAIFKIANVFHDVPLMIERAERENAVFDKIIEDIRYKARQQGCESWLANAISNAERVSPESE